MKLPAVVVVVFGVASPACMVFDEKIDIGDCVTHSECNERLGEPAMCIAEPGTPVSSCKKLISEDCTTITGNPADDSAVLIASLLSTTGAQAATNLARQQAAVMAVEEINSATSTGGVLMSNRPGDTRKLVMLSCDELADFRRVTDHLIRDLHVPAIVGPNLSQDTLDLTTGNKDRGIVSSAEAGTLLLTPASLASAIAVVPDNDLTYMMVPSDIQRVPLMKRHLTTLEQQLGMARNRVNNVKTAIVYRDDALGVGSRDGLSAQIQVNGVSLSMAIIQGKATLDPYPPTLAADSTLVDKYIAFQPDIIVLVGTGEAIKYFMKPLEAAWTARLPSVPKPYYVMQESTKIPDLITLVAAASDDLRIRVRGVGITSTTETASVLNAFAVNYNQRWMTQANSGGLAPAYDAVYAIALALVGEITPTGPNLIAGLRRLSTHTSPCAYDASGIVAPCFTLSDHSRTLFRNMAALLGGEKVAEIGAAGRLDWDPNGAKSNGLVELWCVSSPGGGGSPFYASAGQTYDLKSAQFQGSYTQCP